MVRRIDPCSKCGITVKEAPWGVKDSWEDPGCLKVANRHQARAKGQLIAQEGHATLIGVLLLLAVIVGAIWIWNHFSYETQDYITEEIVPVLMMVILTAVAGGLVVGRIRRRRAIRRRRDLLVNRFKQERSPQNRLELAFELVEVNNYQRRGLEEVAPEMAQLFLQTLRTALDDKQHRIRGMSASYLGAIDHREAIPALKKALKDEHAYVRSSAALALGRLRAQEAKALLQVVQKEDWDQTVRSRAREALERIP